jgi:ribosomal protein S18 acetylase RimI-like enzyme
MDELLLSRIEDAAINASAPPQQRWFDGWLLRFNPGKARRARCIHALAEGRLPLQDKLARCATMYREAGLPMVLRITPFSQPAGLDDALDTSGLQRVDPTWVMVSPEMVPAEGSPQAPAGLHWARLDAADYAAAVGALRGSSDAQIAAHAQRIAMSPVPYHGHVLRRDDDGRALACGQFVREDNLVGLYDVITDPAHRGQGLAQRLCRHLLATAHEAGARTAYLQVEGDNRVAQRLYQRLGFTHAYTYHYRQMPG